MIPVPPLDGGNVLAGLVSGPIAEALDRVRPYGIFILYALMFLGVLFKVRLSDWRSRCWSCCL